MFIGLRLFIIFWRYFELIHKDDFYVEATHFMTDIAAIWGEGPFPAHLHLLQTLEVLKNSSVTQPRLVVSYRRFGTTYRPHILVASNQRRLLDP
jgi:hypothetical protein